MSDQKHGDDYPSPLDTIFPFHRPQPGQELRILLKGFTRKCWTAARAPEPIKLPHTALRDIAPAVGSETDGSNKEAASPLQLGLWALIGKWLLRSGSGRGSLPRRM